MSGVLSAIQAAGSLFGGFGTMTLGPVHFSGLELPENIPIGGTQALSIVNLPGGARHIDVMGPQEGVIAWSGILLSQSQSTRARLLDRMRQSGTPVTLAWGDYNYSVIVSKFSTKTRIAGPMPYQIECVVVQNTTIPTGTSLTSIASQVTADLASGNPLGALSAVSQGVSVPILNANAACALPGATTLGTSIYGDAVSAVNTAASAITTARQYADSLVQEVAGPIAGALGVSASSVSAAGLASAIGAAVNATGDAANLEQARGYTGRVLTNLLNASA